jgi:hypothetical protein
VHGYAQPTRFIEAGMRPAFDLRMAAEVLHADTGSRSESAEVSGGPVTTFDIRRRLKDLL